MSFCEDSLYPSDPSAMCQAAAGKRENNFAMSSAVFAVTLPMLNSMLAVPVLVMAFALFAVS